MSAIHHHLAGRHIWYNEVGHHYFAARLSYLEDRDDKATTYRTTDQISLKIHRLRFGFQMCRYYHKPWYRGIWWGFRELISDNGHQLDFLSMFSIAYRIG